MLYALERAEKVGIKTVVVDRKACADKDEFESKIIQTLLDAGCELVVLAGFMRILSGGFVNKWHHRIINIHPCITTLASWTVWSRSSCCLWSKNSLAVLYIL